VNAFYLYTYIYIYVYLGGGARVQAHAMMRQLDRAHGVWDTLPLESRSRRAKSQPITPQWLLRIPFVVLFRFTATGRPGALIGSRRSVLLSTRHQDEMPRCTSEDLQIHEQGPECSSNLSLSSKLVALRWPTGGNGVFDLRGISQRHTRPPG
jgi:hypothetical protein